MSHRFAAMIRKTLSAANRGCQERYPAPPQSLASFESTPARRKLPQCRLLAPAPPMRASPRVRTPEASTRRAFETSRQTSTKAEEQAVSGSPEQPKPFESPGTVQERTRRKKERTLLSATTPTSVKTPA